MGNPPSVIADAKQGVFASIAAAQPVPSEGNGSSSTSQALATLSGVMLAGAFGWYLVSSRRKGAFGCR